MDEAELWQLFPNDVRKLKHVASLLNGGRGAMEQPTDLSRVRWHHQWRSVPSMRAEVSEKQCRSFASQAMSLSSVGADAELTHAAGNI